MRNRRQINLIVIVLMLMTFVITQAQAALISERMELQLGQQAAAEIESTYKISTDPQLNALVKGIGIRIAAVSSRPNLPWHFRVVVSKSVNAFSVPGYVYVNTGLLNLVGNDRDELAGVIAHEMAHTAARHAAKLIEKQMQYKAAVENLARDGGDWRTGLAIAYLQLLAYDRQDETEADRLAVQYMYAAGYDPNGMLRFFNVLQNKDKNDSDVPEILRSHPSMSSRLVDIANDISALGLKPSLATSIPYSAPAAKGRTTPAIRS